MGHHFEKAAIPEKALKYFELAADTSKKNHYNEEALELYDKALLQLNLIAEVSEIDNSKNLGVRACRMLESQGDIYSINAKVDAAITKYKTAQEQLFENDPIITSRLLRKTGMCHQALSRLNDMMYYLQSAQLALETWEGGKSRNWYEEWIEVNIEKMYFHYWTNESQAMQDYANRIEPHLDSYATPAQKAKFYSYLVALHLRLESYLLSETTIKIAARAYQAAKESNDLQGQSWASFMYGFSFLWKNEMRQAIPYFESSLEMAEKTGDRVIQSRNFTYLAVASRRLYDIKKTLAFTEKSLNVSRQINMLEYVGMSKANLAWVASREESWENVELYAGEAYECWKQLPITGSSHLFIWLAVFPQVAALAHKADYLSCANSLRELFIPGRKRLEQLLEDAVHAFIEHVSDPNPDCSLEKLIQTVLDLAREYKYL